MRHLRAGSLRAGQLPVAPERSVGVRPNLGSPVALHLRAMNMLYEAIKKRGSMVIVPSSEVETMGLGWKARESGVIGHETLAYNLRGSGGRGYLRAGAPSDGLSGRLGQIGRAHV